jgi:hypothetical protein
MILTIIEILLLILLLILISRHLIKKIFNDIETFTNSNSTNSKNKLTYTNTNLNNDSLYLAKTNAANITYLKSRVDNFEQIINNIKNTLNKINKQVESNTYTINKTNTAIASTAQNSLPSKKNFNNLVNQQPIQKTYS